MSGAHEPKPVDRTALGTPESGKPHGSDIGFAHHSKLTVPKRIDSEGVTGLSPDPTFGRSGTRMLYTPIL